MFATLRLWAVVLAFSAGLLCPQTAQASPRPWQVVQWPGLGPLLLPGKDGPSAVRAYLARQSKSGVFTARELKALESKAAKIDHSKTRSIDGLRGQRAIIGVKLNAAWDLLHHGAKVRTSFGPAIREAGGTPIFLAPFDSQQYLSEALGKVDHLVMSGGSDITPSLYGRRNTHSRDTNSRLDHSELRVLTSALNRGLCVDAICRGSQLVNVHQGGTLIQHLPAAGKRGHADSEHEVLAEEGSSLRKVMAGQRFRPMSYHHQAIDKLGSSLQVAARAKDGVIEAFESKDGRLRGYQFHPELSRKPVRQRIFRDIVRRATKNRARPTRVGRQP